MHSAFFAKQAVIGILVMLLDTIRQGPFVFLSRLAGKCAGESFSVMCVALPWAHSCHLFI